MRIWPFGRKQKRAARQIRIVRAKYDAAQSDTHNANHFANADFLSADSAASLSVRKTLRKKARYEVANNSYAKGMVLTLAYHLIGTMPRLQIQTGNPDANTRTESSFRDWCRKVNFGHKLRAMAQSKITDGEIFAVLVNNPGIDHPIKLDFQLVECDRVTSTNATPKAGEVDGIFYDAYGNPEDYTVLKNHPGDVGWWGGYDTYPASSVLHWYRVDRPEQHRGVPEITPSINLFAEMRRYTAAVIASAETAASIALFIESLAPADADADTASPFETLDIEKNMMMTLPYGHKISQTRAEQPTTLYDMFTRCKLMEIARCLNIPYNIAAGDSSDSNFASGKLDHQTYYKAVRVEREDLQNSVIDRILNAWLDEAMLLTEFAFMRSLPRTHEWFYDGFSDIDPLKEANAQAVRLANGTTTLAHEYGLQGKDWEVETGQRARERQKLEELGLIESPINIEEDDEEED